MVEQKKKKLENEVTASLHWNFIVDALKAANFTNTTPESSEYIWAEHFYVILTTVALIKVLIRVASNM